MGTVGPTLSERWTAAQRARLERSRPSTPRGDVAAEQLLYRDVAGRSTPALGPAGPLELRTRVVDAQVAQALGQGIGQVVVVDGGYDGRALRFGGGPARWFEVDHPTTLADKRRRLDALGVEAPWRVGVGLDPLSGHLLGPALEAAGHDADQPTLFVCEEVAVTRTLETTAGILRALRDRAAPAGALVAGFEVAPEVTGVAHSLRSVRRRVTGPGRDLYRPGDPEKLLVVTGWRVTRSESAAPGRLGAGAYAHVLAGEPGPYQYT